MRYKKLVEALEAMVDKRLGIEHMYDGECYCSVGAMLAQAGRPESAANVADFSTARDLLNLKDGDVKNITWHNDNARMCESKEERHTRMLVWAREDV